MAFRVSQAAAKTSLDAMTALLNGGTVEIRTGTQPASPETAASGTLLGTLTLNATAFGAATTASPSVATANAITSDSTADASGTAGWYRAKTSGGTAVCDGAIGAGQDMTMDNYSIVAGGTIAISSWTISKPTS